MSLVVALNGAYEALDQLPAPLPRIANIVRPHIDQARQILTLAIEGDVDEVGARETALVAHTCVLSALARARDEATADDQCREYLSTLESLLEAWPLRRMAEEHSVALSNPSQQACQQTNVSGGGGSVSHVEAAGSTWSTDDPTRTAAAAAVAVAGGGGGGAGGEPWMPAAPQQTARKTANGSGTGGGGAGGGSTVSGSPVGGARMLAKLRISPPSNDAGQAAEVLHRHAIEAMAIAEQAVLDKDRTRVARSFHCAVVYYESLRIFGELRPEVEAKQRYAQWRARHFSHLLENCVHDNLSEHPSVHDVYEVHTAKEQQLGSGSYGTVTTATHRQTGQRYACKQLKLNRATPRYVSKLYHEVAIMRELNHPHVVRLHEVFYARRQIYLIMELATGGELFDLLTAQPGDRFEEPFAADLMAQMLSAVHYIHARGVVHRDLKLENFLLEGPIAVPPPPSCDSPKKARTDGGGGGGGGGGADEEGAEALREALPMAVVKLIDFGLSKHFHHHEIMQQQVGSAYYVAPEVLKGHYNESCDMWSMGVVLYMLVSGVPPFWGRSDAEIRQRTLRGKYSFPARQFADVSGEAVDLIRRLLELDPERRITAAEALKHPWITKAQQAHLAAVEASAASSFSSSSSSSSSSMATDDGAAGGAAQKGEVVDGASEVPTDVEIASSLRQFSDFTAMRKLMLELVAFTLSAAQISGLREEFEALDSDKSGTLSVDDVRRVFLRVGSCGGGGGGAGKSSVLEEEISRIFDAVSVHHGHSINYTEFIAATVWQRIHIEEDRIHQAFDLLDKDHVGFLTADAIQNAVGQDFSPEAVASMVAECDFNGDGRVDYLEFERLWKSYSVDRHQEGLGDLHGHFHRHHVHRHHHLGGPRGGRASHGQSTVAALAHTEGLEGSDMSDDDQDDQDEEEQANDAAKQAEARVAMSASM